MSPGNEKKMKVTIPRESPKSPNETTRYLSKATAQDCELKKEDLDFRKKQEEKAAAQQNLMFQQQ